MDGRVSSLIGSPWAHLADLSPAQIVRSVLTPVSAVMATEVAKRVEWVGVSEGRLIYGAAGRRIAGGPPCAEPGVHEAWSHLDWTPSAELRGLYGVHGGLGPLGAGGWCWRDGVVSPDSLAPLSSRVRFGEDTILYDPSRWWVAANDGAGGAWCVSADAPEVAHFDQVSHRLGPTIPLSRWIDGLVQRWW